MIFMFFSRVWSPAQVLQRIPAATTQPFREWPPQTRCPKFWFFTHRRWGVLGKMCLFVAMASLKSSAVCAIQGLMIFGGAQVSIAFVKVLLQTEEFRDSDFEHGEAGSETELKCQKNMWSQARRLTDYTSGTLFKPQAQDTLITALFDLKRWNEFDAFRILYFFESDISYHFFFVVGQAFPVVPVLRPMWTRRRDFAFQRWGGEALTVRKTKNTQAKQNTKERREKKQILTKEQREKQVDWRTSIACLIAEGAVSYR